MRIYSASPISKANNTIYILASIIRFWISVLAFGTFLTLHAKLLQRRTSYVDRMAPFNGATLVAERSLQNVTSNERGKVYT